MRVRYKDGIAPAYASFALVSHPTLVDKEIEVVRRLRTPEVLEAALAQCEAGSPSNLVLSGRLGVAGVQARRITDTAALLQALEKAAEQGRNSPAWKVPLTEPDLSALEASKEEVVEHREAAPEAQAAQPLESAPFQEAARQEAPPPARGTGRGRWFIAGFIALLLLGALGVLFGRATLAPSPTAERGASAPTPRRNPTMPQSTTSQDSATSLRGSSLSSLLAASLCAATTLGCPAAQVRPEPTDCPTETTDVMFKELKLTTPGCQAPKPAPCNSRETPR